MQLVFRSGHGKRSKSPEAYDTTWPAKAKEDIPNRGIEPRPCRNWSSFDDWERQILATRPIRMLDWTIAGSMRKGEHIAYTMYRNCPVLPCLRIQATQIGDSSYSQTSRPRNMVTYMYRFRSSVWWESFSQHCSCHRTCSQTIREKCLSPVLPTPTHFDGGIEWSQRMLER